MKHPDGSLYPRQRLREYLDKLGIAVSTEMRYDCDLLVAADPKTTSRKAQEAARLNKPVIAWEEFAAMFQIAGFADPPRLRYWQATFTKKLWAKSTTTSRWANRESSYPPIPKKNGEGYSLSPSAIPSPPITAPSGVGW